MGAQRRGVGSQLPPAPTEFIPCILCVNDDDDDNHNDDIEIGAICILPTSHNDSAQSSKIYFNN